MYHKSTHCTPLVESDTMRVKVYAKVNGQAAVRARRDAVPDAGKDVAQIALEPAARPSRRRAGRRSGLVGVRETAPLGGGREFAPQCQCMAWREKSLLQSQALPCEAECRAREKY